MYHHTLLNQWQQLRAVLHPLEASQNRLSEFLESDDLLHHLEEDATEMQPGIWSFKHVPSNSPTTTLYGLKFQEPISAQWAYLMLWRNGSESGADPFPLMLEAEVFQRSISLDHQYYHQQQQAEHCQQVLRRIEHQIRNPLAVIHLYASNLHRSLDQEGDRLQVVAIRDAVRYLSDHLTEMLAGCQRTHIQADRCDVRSLMAEVWEGLQLLARDKQARITWPTQPLYLMGDRAQLLQLFENLLHNALCFSPPGGQITVHWQEFHREVLITIADQGPGLTPMDLQQMFCPYYSKRPQGSGLGLAIAQKIVQDHGGKIWADNLPSPGAQLSIVLPQNCPQHLRVPSPVDPAELEKVP